MALFDKLKEKVNSMVDVDKLGEMASKTVSSVKQEVAKAIDPSIKEQERLAKEKALQEQKEQKEKALQEQREQEKLEREKAIEAFWSSNNLDEELDYIFSVLEKSGATASNFEKGIEHFISKTEGAKTIPEIFPTMKKALFVRAFDSDNCATAKAVAMDYFKESVIDSTKGLLDKYMRFRASRDQGYGLADFEHPFIKSLYGITGRVINYKIHGLNSGDYQPVSPEYYIDVIESNDVLKSYTDKDPFTADEVRKAWSNDLYNSPIELVNANDLSSAFNDEKQIDEAFYIVYLGICQELGVDSNEISIVDAYFDYLQKIYK